MKTSAIIITALLVGASLRADEASEVSTPKLDYSITSNFSFTSEYVFRGTKVTDQAFQPSVEVDSNNFDLGIWTSQPIVHNEQNEIDIYGGYKYAVTKDLSVQAVVTYYDYPEFNKTSKTNIDGARNSFEPGIGATYTIAGFSPSAFYYYDTVLKQNTGLGSLGYALPLASLGTELDLTGYYGIVGGRDVIPSLKKGVHQSYKYTGADLSLPYKLAANTTLTLAAHYANNFHTPAGTKKDLVWWSVGLAIGF
jgi:uncharacterized protein (TIGR02001 family)